MFVLEDKRARLASERVHELLVLGFMVQSDGTPRGELDHHLRCANRAWGSLRRALTCKWIMRAERYRALVSRVFVLAISPGAGSWALDQAALHALRQWELAKVGQAFRFLYPRSADDPSEAYRRLEALASGIAAATGQPRLLQRYFEAMHALAVRWPSHGIAASICGGGPAGREMRRLGDSWRQR